MIVDFFYLSCFLQVSYERNSIQCNYTCGSLNRMIVFVYFKPTRHFSQMNTVNGEEEATLSHSEIVCSSVLSDLHSASWVLVVLVKASSF